MNWYYALGGQQQGPVDDAALDSLIAAGTLNPETLVWREGMATWQALRVARPGSASATAGGLPPVIVQTPPTAEPGPAPGEVACAECGKYFSRENTIQYGSAFVCANCKPIFVQKIREGTAPGGGATGQPGLPFDPEAFLATIRERDYEIDIGACLSRGWDLVKSHFWISVGAFVVTYACLIGAQMIPIVGMFAPLIINGPLMGGLYYFFIKLSRGEDASVGDVFSGFTKAFLQLFLIALVSTLLSLVCMIPAFGTLIALLVAKADISPILVGALFVIGFVPLVYLNVCWLFSMQLVIDKEMNFWAAMELSRKVVNMHWGYIFLFLVVCFLVACLGVFALCIGVLVAVPVLLAAVVYAYEDIFGVRRPQIA